MSFSPTELAQIVAELRRQGIGAPVGRSGGGGGPFTGVRAACYAFPSEVCVDGRGRVTQITPGDGSPSGPASGDLGEPGGSPTPASGDYPSPAVVGLQGRAIDSVAPALNEALWDGSAWAPAPVGRGPMVFGARRTGTVATTRFLFPGYDRNGIAPTSVVPQKATQDGVLRFLHVVQTPGVGAGTITYTVVVGGVPTALSLTLPVTATDGSNIVDTPTVAANDDVAVEITLAGAIGTQIFDPVATVQQVVAS